MSDLGHVDKRDTGAGVVFRVEIIATVVLGTLEPRNRAADQRNVADHFNFVFGWGERLTFLSLASAADPQTTNPAKSIEGNPSAVSTFAFFSICNVSVPEAATLSISFLASKPPHCALSFSDVFLQTGDSHDFLASKARPHAFDALVHRAGGDRPGGFLGPGLGCSCCCNCAANGSLRGPGHRDSGRAAFLRFRRGKLRLREDYHNHAESKQVLEWLLEVRSPDGDVLYRNERLG